MKQWLEEALGDKSLSEEAEGYLLRRGAKPETYTRMGVTVWQVPGSPAPDPENRLKRHGPRWESLQGKLAFPLLSPNGDLIGVEFRGMQKKSMDRYLLPEAKWNPVWHMLPGSIEALWAGKPAWVVEGVFDLFAMEWVLEAGSCIFAAMTAALSGKQVEFLRRFAKSVNVCFDRDGPGLKGIHGGTDENGKYWPGALHLLRKVEVPCVEIEYRGGKDPGELWDQKGRDMKACFVF